MAGQNPWFSFKNASGNLAPASLDAQGNQGQAQGQASYYTPNLAGRVFRGGNQAGATLSVGLATTYLGLCLSNPAASGKNLIVLRVTGQIIIAPAAVLSLGLIEGFLAAGITVHTTALTIGSALIGSATVASIAKLDAACTLVGTPVWTDWSWANGASAGLGGFALDLKGAVIIPPGGYLAIGGNVAGPTAGFVGSMRWIEQ